jgi:hypothetical protein
MNGLAPIALGMVGLEFALFGNALALLGVDAQPLTAQGPSPGRAVGVASSLIGALSLIFMAFWLVMGAPLGRDGALVPVQLTFSAISGMYGFLFLAFGVVQVLDWDVRPVGNVALICALMQVIEIFVVVGWGLTTGNLLTLAVLATYTVTLVGFWATTHGKFPPRAQAVLLLLSALGTFYFQFWASGILPGPP